MVPFSGCIVDVTERVCRHDFTLEWIVLNNLVISDSMLQLLLDCLLKHPSAIVGILLRGNYVTDETGVKLARYLAASPTMRTLDLSHNWLSKTTYVAMAKALHVNTSLIDLYLHDDRTPRSDCTEIEFINALRFNPRRPAKSKWNLYVSEDADLDYSRLERLAAQSGPPTMLCAASPLRTQKKKIRSRFF